MRILTYFARMRSPLAALWLGMLIGVSFIATPVKFQASGLTLPVALDVGRLTFEAFARVEWGLAFLLAIATLAWRPWGWRGLVLAALIAGLVVQSVWLFPALERQVEMIIGGGSPEASRHHFLYAAVEVAKAAGLLALGIPSRQAVERRAEEELSSWNAVPPRVRTHAPRDWTETHASEDPRRSL